MLDREQQHAAGAVEGKGNAAPATFGSGCAVATVAGFDRTGREATGVEFGATGLDVRGREREADQSVAVRVEPHLEHRPGGSVAVGSEQLEVGVLDAEQHVRGSAVGMHAAPRRREAEDAAVVGFGGVEVAHREDHVVEGVQQGSHGPEDGTKAGTSPDQRRAFASALAPTRAR